MDRLEAKKVHGQTYYYYTRWGWRDGKCRRLWQKYLGKPERIFGLLGNGDEHPRYAEVFEWGLSEALWQECVNAKVIEIINRACPKRSQGLSTGEYLALAAINRSIEHSSKASIGEWFSKTTLIHHFKGATKSVLSSQRFWDHMDRISSHQIEEIWKCIITETIRKEGIDLSSISYDGTNFYTFIDTFNTRCVVAKRGKNKQGRNNLRQVSYAVFCTADSHIPLYYDIYEGNRNDAKQFPEMLTKFYEFWHELSEEKIQRPTTTIIFDKGNNSLKNFELIDSYQLKFVGSVKGDEHKEEATISRHDPRFETCDSPELSGVKAIRFEKEIYGKKRSLIVTYNPALFKAQYLTVRNDMRSALAKLSVIEGKLEGRLKGNVTKGKVPTVGSLTAQCKKILSRPYMARIIRTHIQEGNDKLPTFTYEIDNEAFDTVCDRYLGKTLIITNRREWDTDAIIVAYRSQYIVEDVFKEMKDRSDGSWWPLYHWTDSKIRVHGLYCTIALTLRAVLIRRLHKADIKVSMKRMLTELKDIREVVTVLMGNNNHTKRPMKEQRMLTKLNDVQKRILHALKLNHTSYSF